MAIDRNRVVPISEGVLPEKRTPSPPGAACPYCGARPSIGEQHKPGCPLAQGTAAAAQPSTGGMYPAPTSERKVEGLAQYYQPGMEGIQSPTGALGGMTGYGQQVNAKGELIPVDQWTLQQAQQYAQSQNVAQGATIFGMPVTPMGGETRAPGSPFDRRQPATGTWQPTAAQQPAQAGAAPEAAQGPLMQYFQPPPYIGPEDVQGVPQFQAPGTAGAQGSEFYSGTYTGAGEVPQFGEPETEESKFYSFTEGDYERLEKDLFETTMARAGSWAAAHGVMSSGGMERATATAASEAMRTRYGLQAAEMGRRTEWEQAEERRRWEEAQIGYTGAATSYQLGEREAARRTGWEQQEAERRTEFEQQEGLLRWQESELKFRAEQAAYQQAQQEAQMRNTWMWNTYTMQHSDYWNEISTLLSNIIAPYSAVPYEGVKYGVM